MVTSTYQCACIVWCCRSASSLHSAELCQLRPTVNAHGGSGVMRRWLDGHGGVMNRLALAIAMVLWLGAALHRGDRAPPAATARRPGRAAPTALASRQQGARGVAG